MRAVTAFVNELGELVVYDPTTHELRIYEPTSGKDVSLAAQPSENNEDLKFYLPNRYAPSGLKSLLRVTSTGRIQVQDPAAYLADLAAVVVSGTHNQGELQGFFDAIIAKVNDILTALRNQNVIQPQTVTVVPAAASIELASNGPLIITPDPAVFAIECDLGGVPTFTLEAVDPTVTIS